MEQHSFGYWLKLKRKAQDFTREELAERVGYSAATIRKIEDEERRPSAQIVERLAELFSIPQNERVSFLRFARGDWKSAPGETQEELPWSGSSKSTSSNLPAPVTSLIGREKEVAVVHEYLLSVDIRLVTLIGPPGIGKTRLSIEAARVALPDFQDGVCFVALAPLDDPSLIAPTVIQALGYVEAKHQSAGQQLVDGIGNKHMLLVLDNCEHLIEEVATLVSDLLSGCPRLKILATSRESLRVPGEWLYSVPTLDVPTESSSLDIETATKFPALALFAERARAVQPDFALKSENIKAVSAICTQLDGLPLAIELIAARVRLMSPQALLERLSGQFTLHADGVRAVSARQKTLHNAIAWSYGLLSEDEQKLFVHLSVFAGGFTLEAAESIFSRILTTKTVFDLIVSLSDKSLLQRTVGARGKPRFSMLVTIQQFALDRLQRKGAEAEARSRHLAYFLALAEQGDQEIRGANQIEWLHRLGAMRDNFRAALQWAIETGQTESALQMARKLHRFLSVIGDHSEGRQWLGRVVAFPDAPLYPQAYAEALTQLAHHIWIQTGPKEAKPFAEQALFVARAHKDKWNIAKALVILGLVLTVERDFESAQSMFEESQGLFQQVGDRWGYAHTIMGLGLAASLQDDEAKTLTLHEQALVLFRELGDRYFQGVSYRFIGNTFVKQGDWKQGIAALREALILAQELNSKWETYAVLWSLSQAEQGAGEPARAVRFYCTAKNIADSIGAWQPEDQVEFENNLASCRAALSEKAFADSLEEGRAMTMEQAVAYALETRE